MANAKNTKTPQEKKALSAQRFIGKVSEELAEELNQRAAEKPKSAKRLRFDKSGARGGGSGNLNKLK